MKKLFILVFALVFAGEVPAQVMPETTGPDSVATAILPVAGYNSDIGFLFGGIYSRYDYTGNRDPFRSLQQAKVLASTKGYIQVEGLYEKTDSPAQDFRTTVEGYLYRYAKDTFFGIGNNTTYEQERWDEEYYYFESVSFGLEYKLRKSLYREGRASFDISGGLGTDYQIAYERQTNSAFAQNSPPGHRGGWVNFVSGGFVWENRDSEFDARRGNRASFNLQYAPKPLTDFSLTTVTLDLRQYVYLLDFLKIAGRLEARHAGANVPYWELSTLGDDYTLRGYPRNRFMGNTSIAYNLEARTWLFIFPQYQLKLGGHVFTDGGRVFGNEDDAADLFNNYKKTVGFGGAMSLFSPDFILRGEIGFSEDTARIYVGVGYMF